MKFMMFDDPGNHISYSNVSVATIQSIITWANAIDIRIQPEYYRAQTARYNDLYQANNFICNWDMKCNCLFIF